MLRGLRAGQNARAKFAFQTGGRLLKPKKPAADSPAQNKITIKKRKKDNDSEGEEEEEPAVPGKKVKGVWTRVTSV